MPSEKKNKRILIVCPYPENVAPGQRLKYEQYFDHWRANGYDLTISPFISRKFWGIVYQPGKIHLKVLWTIWGYLRRIWDLIRAPFYDGIYVFLWVTPFGFPWFEKLLVGLNSNLIYDIDDMVFLGHVSDANKFILKLKGRSKMIYLMKKARHVITCTPKLDEFVRQYNQKTTDISSTIDTETYKAKTNYNFSEPITLGWSGSHSTSKYLHLIQEPLKQLSQKFPIRLQVIGDLNFTMEGIEVNAMAWKRETEVQDLGKIDIGLYPLPNEDWVLGKSGLKALQYMALGIPTIATNIGANSRIIRDGENGFLVENLKDWEEKVKLIIEDKALRKSMGEAARETVQEKFSIHANKKTYLTILKENI